MNKSSYHLLSTTFRSWDNREKMMGFSPEIDITADFQMIHQKTLCIGKFTNCY
ncbi:MAG TPA: hypothetical protein PK081_02340 [Bacteroidales bacterium]|nr:hypothetical protein [Bacteroidales bacterium]